MAAAGFAERALPDGRILRMCAGPVETTIAEIGRQLGITRQGAGKIVAGLVERGYVTLRRSTTDGREKVVVLTPRALDYLRAQRDARQAIGREMESKLGAEAIAALYRLLDVLDAGEDATFSVYLRQMRHAGALRRPED